MEKCFCHLNGYAVKDATARKDIETLKNNKISTEQMAIERATLNSAISKVDTRVKNLEKAVTNIPDSAEDITFNAEGLEAKNTKEAILEVKEIAEGVASEVIVTNLQNQLTAEDGHAFRFAVNSEGEYGYIVPDSEGADTFHPFNSMDLSLLVTALQHSNLGITEESTYEEICSALSNKFLPELVDKVSTWRTDGINNGASSSRVSKTNHVVEFWSAFASGHTAFCETDNIPVGEYSKMFVNGYVSFGSGANSGSATLEVITDEGVVATVECTTWGKQYRIDKEINACTNLRLAFTGANQEVSSKFSIKLYN